ncbi:MAG: SpoVR family protein [Salinirussus sp.]
MKQPVDEVRMQRLAEDLEEPVTKAAALARTLGLDPYPVNYWIVDYDEMNELIAYGGFQHRYPHWRWGMQYDRQQKQRQFLGGKAFEIVNNDAPANAFLQESNSLADQKAVITHVEAHADFFANNGWFGLFADEPDAAAMLARHADAVAEIMDDPEIDRAAVEKWIDHCLCLEDNIDQHSPYEPVDPESEAIPQPIAEELEDDLGELEFSDEVREQVFDEEWLEARRDDESATFPAEPEPDVLGFLRQHGKQYDREAEQAVEMEDWQQEILEIVRREAYYFAAQQLTKVMNEGWAAYHESLMMADENFADADEFITYADHMARVLGSPGLNPYKLGKELWEYVEMSENRRHVAEQLLRVDGITWRNFHDRVDFDRVMELLEPDPLIASIDADSIAALDPDDRRVDPDGLADARAGTVDLERYPWTVLSYEGMAERHYALTKRKHRGALRRIRQAELERISRYLFDDTVYDTVEAAIADIEYTIGWDRMREIRESHNDVTFIDEFLTQEFVDENDYFTYEYLRSSDDYRVTSTDYQDVKKKLLLRFTNFGKPRVVVADGNFRNRNELLLEYQYNGVVLDISEAKKTLERVFELWGRPVHLRTIDVVFDEHDVEVARRRDSEPEGEEVGKLISFDGMDFSVDDLDWAEVEHLAASDIDYDTKPDEWLA